jgi:AraC family ethanolamine operon transcriptional activator
MEFAQAASQAFGSCAGSASFSEQFEDPEAVVDALRPRVRGIEPHSRRFRYRLEKLELNGLTLVREAFEEGASLCGVPAPGTRSLGLLSQRGERLALCLGRELESGSMLVTQDGQEWSAVVPKASRYHNLVFDPVVVAALIETTRGAPIRLDLPQGQVVLEGPHGARLRLAAVLDATWTQLHLLGASHLPGGAVDQIREAVLDALAPVLISMRRIRPGTSSTSRRARAVEMAIAHAEARSSGVVGVASLCRVAGVSRRTLEYAFREIVGLGPASYLKLRRLESARRELEISHPSETVTSVALRWGFIDMSQFAHDYRRQFGELPSETLAKS